MPKNMWIDHLNVPQTDKTKWIDIWDIFDKKIAEEEFQILNFNQVKEIYLKSHLMGDGRSYTANIKNHIDNLYNFSDILENKNTAGTTYCIFNDITKYQDHGDFEKFSDKRILFDIDRNEKYIHFEQCLFGNYCYHVYAGDLKERNILKNKINKVFRYHEKYYDIFNFLNFKNYNAVHVRRNDFLTVCNENIKNIVKPNDLYQALERLFPKDIPLYICTDETNLSYFNKIKKKYKVIFFKDFNLNLTDLEKAIVEQIICSKADLFYGTFPSTYSKRINIMRGIEGLQSSDYMSINRIIEPPEYLKSAMPWTYNEGRFWNWDHSTHINWLLE